MRIALIQTAAGPAYEAMLAATAPIHRAFCERNDMAFASHIGVIRGFHPWQASFNRIALLHRLVEEGFDGWAMYLDADAIIVQPDFDIRRYLGKRDAFSMIAVPGSRDAHLPWDINNGVFLLNLARPAGREIVLRWREAADRLIDDDMLRVAESPWQPLPDGRPFPDDQHLLQAILAAQSDLAETLHLERGGLLNFAGGRFVRQYLRTVGSPEERLAFIRQVAERLTGLSAG